VTKRPAGQRIYVSADIDHLSIEADEWLPLCGQKSRRGFVPVLESTVYQGRLCTRCAALAEQRRP
jgi:hypothetical protein